MARARGIKPGFFRNADLVELPVETRLLFIGLWTIADKAGRLEDRPKQIKMELYPADSFDVDAMLQQLHDTGFIQRYEHNKTRYIQVVNFSKHQNPHRDEKASSIPAPCEHDANTVQAPYEEETNTVAIGLTPDSLLLTPEEKAESKTKPALATRLPADWKPSNIDILFCETERPDLKPFVVADSFRDYWISVAGSKGKKLDWPATWRNWVRNQKQAQGAPPGKQANRDSYDAQARAAAEQLNQRTRDEHSTERDITSTCTRIAG